MDKGMLRATFGYTKTLGVVENTDLERITGRINAVHRFFDDDLTVNLQVSISRVNDGTAPLSGGSGFRGDLLGASYSANPTWPNDPTFTDGGTQLLPANFLENSLLETKTNRLLVNGSAEYKFTDELTGKVNIGYDKSTGQNFSAVSGNILNLAGVEGQGFGVFNTLVNENRLLEATLNYKKEFENSNLDVLLGFSYQDFGTSGINSAGRGFDTTNLEIYEQ